MIAEMIWLDEWGRRYIQSNNIYGWQQYLIQNGWKSYAQRLIELVLTGQVDPLDAEKFIGPIDKQHDELRFDYRISK